MRKLDWVGLAVVILAAGLSIGWAATLIIVAVDSDPLSSSAAHLLSAVGGLMGGAIAAFVGMNRWHHGDHSETRPERRDGGDDKPWRRIPI